MKSPNPDSSFSEGDTLLSPFVLQIGGLGVTLGEGQGLSAPVASGCSLSLQVPCS